MTNEHRIVTGEKMYVNGNHHPCRATGTIWYRHDRVQVQDGDGWRDVPGHVQVKWRQFGRGPRAIRRIETLTSVGGYGVTGCSPEWLIAQAGLKNGAA